MEEKREKRLGKGRTLLYEKASIGFGRADKFVFLRVGRDGRRGRRRGDM
jgi:hypothetical protein